MKFYKNRQTNKKYRIFTNFKISTPFSSCFINFNSFNSFSALETSIKSVLNKSKDNFFSVKDNFFSVKDNFFSVKDNFFSVKDNFFSVSIT